MHGEGRSGDVDVAVVLALVTGLLTGGVAVLARLCDRPVNSAMLGGLLGVVGGGAVGWTVYRLVPPTGVPAPDPGAVGRPAWP
ncbi:hypothetical protein [Streptomyces sp. NBC_00073]|uniref:hypothetical protein n=1 Tax=Streptomyces sp. NBC_00073 TaxID=2975640 RepID=UPI0032457FCA